MRKMAIVMAAVMGLGCVGTLRAAVADEGVTAEFEKNLTVQNEEKYIQTTHEQAAQEIEKLKTDATVEIQTDLLRESQAQSAQEDVARQIKQAQDKELKEHEHWATEALKAKGKMEELSKEIKALQAKNNGPSPNAADAAQAPDRIQELKQEQMAEEKNMKNDEAKAGDAQNVANLQIKVLTAQEVTSGLEAQKEAALAAEAQKKTTEKIDQIASGAVDTLKKNEQGQIQYDQNKETQYLAQQADTDKQVQQVQLKEDREHKKCAESLVATQKTLDDLAQQVNEETKKMDAARLEGPEGNAPMVAEEVNKLWGDIKLEQKVQKDEQFRDVKITSDADTQVTDLRAQGRTFGLEAKMEAYLAGEVQSRTDKAVEHLTTQEKTPFKTLEDGGLTVEKTAPTKIKKTRHTQHKKVP